MQLIVIHPHREEALRGTTLGGTNWINSFSILHAGGRSLFLENELDVYAQSNNRIGHAFQLERLRLRSWVGSNIYNTHLYYEIFLLKIHVSNDNKLWIQFVTDFNEIL